jgi:hypothetical protein
VVDLGKMLPHEHIRSALGSIFRYNFRENFDDFPNTQRIYALNDEAGLLLCSWPKGKRPAIPFPYSDEVWTGIEYQVAAHLIYEGRIDEGLTMVSAVRDRHSGANRNPWNEVECGNHYARSLASWAILLALGGQHYRAHSGELDFAPAAPGPFRGFFSTGSAWGRVDIDEGGVLLHVDGGELALTTLRLHGRPLTPDAPIAGPVPAGSDVRFPATV